LYNSDEVREIGTRGRGNYSIIRAAVIITMQRVSMLGRIGQIKTRRWRIRMPYCWLNTRLAAKAEKKGYGSAI
jgi:hypothetical protein